MSKDFNLLATIRVMPDGVDIDLEDLKSKIEGATPEDREVHRIDEEPIAFGIVALNVLVLSNDKEGGDVDPVVDIYSELEGVSEVDVTDVRRLL
ncbi:MAG TPA: elongation factor 1-beta [Candidatus Methanofastidiosa archaeon]|nr:elongation factor 1-beta [Candidatus Methanofastidiosa archaeon]HPR41264.1 elongation factor 1-beta [Candidatus Methanofastidiosa archaeon]